MNKTCVSNNESVAPERIDSSTADEFIMSAITRGSLLSGDTNGHSTLRSGRIRNLMSKKNDSSIGDE